MGRRIGQTLKARWLAWRSAIHTTSVGGDGRDRGDVPGWVMITVMTAALVVAIATLATPALQNLFTSAINSVSGVGGGGGG
ncbi:hypothetical protein FF36_01916 [Frankia torreyi]|uniref:Uncharacterized protein n=1 Tax=Frankia torreyi TaxID=1856 RepID=A0A0D8BHY7_9ACTN|nr:MULTISPECIES: hypothetical protein [Frankia]KJE23731.1 hypothetical protein FF36_01916 [Frankia torreyi]KQC38986.1 hypothetical protein UK82_07220 [Frankia sp. ACN1ag]KQM05657.1 hypothetical protein FF86_101475 [Frankia sp. CpI1-P]